LPCDRKRRRVKYLNNIIEQDHGFIRKRWRAMQCLRTFHTAERSLEGFEEAHMTRKGQLKSISGEDVVGQANFVASLFGVVA
jgi:transposase-like protein